MLPLVNSCSLPETAILRFLKNDCIVGNDFDMIVRYKINITKHNVFRCYRYHLDVMRSEGGLKQS